MSLRNSSAQKITVQSLYSSFKKEALQQERDLRKICMGESTYYVTYALKYEHLYSHSHCQLIVYYDKNDEYFFGFAYESTGFPKEQGRYPCLKEKIALKEISSVKIQKQYLKIESEKHDITWFFKFFNDKGQKMPTKWYQFLVKMQQKRQIRNKLSAIDHPSNLKKGGYYILQKVLKQLQNNDICLTYIKNHVGFECIKQTKKVEQTQEQQQKIGELIEQNMKLKKQIKEIEEKYRKQKQTEKLDAKVMKQENRQLKSQVLNLQYKLNKYAQKVQRKEERIKQVQKFLEEKQEDEQILREFLQQLSTLEQKASVGNSILFESMSSVQNKSNISRFSSILQEILDLRNMLSNVDSSVANSFSNGRKSFEEEKSQSFMVELSKVDRSSAPLPISEAEYTVNRLEAEPESKDDISKGHSKSQSQIIDIEKDRSGQMSIIEPEETYIKLQTEYAIVEGEEQNSLFDRQYEEALRDQHMYQ